ncbi:MAG: hypothetical protein ABI895_08170 [Deltaproteobacteria bacterium]
MQLRSSGCWVVVVLIGCGSDDGNLDDAPQTSGPRADDVAFGAGGGSASTTPGAASNPGNNMGADSNGSAPTPAVPEQEEENTFRVPVVTGRLIWAANPVSGRVALVDAVTHEVLTLPAGLAPTYLAAIPGVTANRALVINSGSTDATLFRQTASGGELAQLQIPLHQNANAWTLSDDGHWAVAWSDAREFKRLDATEGLQDVTVLDLSKAPPALARFSVGYRPVKLQIDAAGTHVYAVTHDGISVIELGATPRLSDDIGILSATDALSAESGEPVLEDVPITRDGRYAVVRFAGAPRLQVIDLTQRTSQLLELPGEASDVDLAGDGERAVAVLRDSSQVAVFDPAVVITDPSQVVLRSFSGETLGSAALPENGDTALLFTTATDSDRLAILDLANAGAASPRVVSLKAPIRAVFPTPEGSYAVALLETEANSERAGAFSVVPIAAALPPKIQGTDAPPYRVSLAQTPSGLRGLVTTRDDAHGIHAAYLVRMPSLQVDRIDLSSPPIAVGLLPEFGVGYVAQQHPEGRITFIDLETGAPQTLTGFELADRVVNGDEP